MGGMKPGGEPFSVNKELCQKTAEGAVQQELQRRKKIYIWQEIQLERLSASFWANQMFQLKMTELRPFRSSQILIHFS